MNTNTKKQSLTLFFVGALLFIFAGSYTIPVNGDVSITFQVAQIAGFVLILIGSVKLYKEYKPFKLCLIFSALALAAEIIVPIITAYALNTSTFVEEVRKLIDQYMSMDESTKVDLANFYALYINYKNSFILSEILAIIVAVVPKAGTIVTLGMGVKLIMEEQQDAESNRAFKLSKKYAITSSITAVLSCVVIYLGLSVVQGYLEYIISSGNYEFTSTFYSFVAGCVICGLAICVVSIMSLVYLIKLVIELNRCKHEIKEINPYVYEEKTEEEPKDDFFNNSNF